jgi:hypothetical protein
MTRIIAAALALAVLTAGASAECLGCTTTTITQSAKRHHYASDPRPARWCGWWMRHHLGVADKAGNRARWWARYGTRAGGPAPGVIVVWPHHVGIITGRGEDGWIVKSGNDGGRVRERERSLRGVIAYRVPGARMAMQ